MNREQRARYALGQRSAQRVLAWLEQPGNRDKVRAAVARAVAETEERKKARRIDWRKLDQPFNF